MRHASRTVSWLPFGWNAFDGSRSTKPAYVERKPVIILEGVYAARPELSDLIDLRVLLSTPEPVRNQAPESPNVATVRENSVVRRSHRYCAQ